MKRPSSVVDLACERELRTLRKSYECAMDENAKWKRLAEWQGRLIRSMVRVVEQANRGKTT